MRCGWMRVDGASAFQWSRADGKLECEMPLNCGWYFLTIVSTLCRLSLYLTDSGRDMSRSSNHLCKFQSAFTFSSISYLDVKIIVWKKPDMPEASLVQVSVEVFGTIEGHALLSPTPLFSTISAACLCRFDSWILSNSTMLNMIDTIKPWQTQVCLF